jgi:hypothetical protein
MYGGLADLHIIRQLPLRGQTVPGAQLAGEDHPHHLLHEQLPDGGRDDFFEFHGGLLLV